MIENFERFPNQSKPPITTIQDEDDKISINFKVKNFTEETNIDYRKYESFNILNKNGDNSIYTPNSSEEEKKLHLNIINVVDILEELGDQIKSLQKGLALLRNDLVKAGVLKAI
jgi:hypothetical protein